MILLKNQAENNHLGCAARDPAVPPKTSLCQPIAWIWPVTSSSLRLCSFCSSIRFCRSASNCRLCSSFSRCCCSSCCRRRASDRSLFASCSRKKSRLSVDSPGRFRMELHRREASEKVLLPACLNFLPGGVRSGFPVWALSPSS